MSSNEHNTSSYLISPLDERYSSKIISLAELFSEYGLHRARVQVEVRWWAVAAKTLHDLDLSEKQQQACDSVWKDFNQGSLAAIRQYEQTTRHDVKAVEYYLQDRWKELDLPFAELIHFGLTSEDTNSCAYGLLLIQAQRILVGEVLQLLEGLIIKAEQWADKPVLARTHGQPAVPTTMGKEMLVFAQRLGRQLLQLQQQKFAAKLSGAVGTGAAWHAAADPHDWLSISQQFIQDLGLHPDMPTTQVVSAESYSEFFHILIRINAICLDIDRDCWDYISRGYFKLTKAKGQVGSSTMPQKVNPIDFENSEGNIGISTSLLTHFTEKLPISRLQRDLSDSTVKRNIGVAVAHAVIAYQSTVLGLSKLAFQQDMAITELLTHWEVLAEAVQTILRAAGVTDGYQQLQSLTQGKQNLDHHAYSELINQLAVSDDKRQVLLALTPVSYLGFTQQLTQQSLSDIHHLVQTVKKGQIT